jgi:23S rRNA pseudouridine2604 synthase
MRINKYLAEKNISTRRGADELIKKGLIKINGKIAKLGDQVTENDKVEVSKGAERKDYIYLAYNKPEGIVTNAPQGKEEEISDKIKTKHKVFPIGRLDKDSTGLIILTNDGRITGPLLTPEREHDKEYLVKVDRPFDDMFLRKMGLGVKLDDYKTKPAEIKRHSRDSFKIILTEGKKRQIRRMCETLGYHVKELRRTRIMNINIGLLKPNEYRQLGGAELKAFLKDLKVI